MKKFIKFSRENYFIVIFGLIILFVGVVSAKKLFFTKPTFIYTKVKVGQGLWWAGGQKPGIWLANSIKKGDVERDLLGRSIAEVLNVRYYPWYAIDQYDIYLTVKLRINSLGKSKKYNFKRSALGVGAPIELELPSVQVSGTVIEISQKPFEDQYTEKTVYLTKQFAYLWEYEAIVIGEGFFDGENLVFQVIDKKSDEKKNIISPQKTVGTNIIGMSISESRQTITVKAKVMVKENDGRFVFGEEQKLFVGKTFNILAPSFAFNDYVIAKIE